MTTLACTLRSLRGVNLDLPSSGLVRILGDNGTGKTSLADAWSWLWTGKDSQGRSDSEIIPRDGNHATVVGTIDIGGRERTISRAIDRDKKGKSTTTYGVDGAPISSREWEDIGNEYHGGYFRVLTDPVYFSGLMTWRERRALLMRLVEVSKPSGEYQALLGLDLDLEKRRVDSERKRIKKDLDALPAAIAELQALAPATGDRKTLAAELIEVEKLISNQTQAARNRDGAKRYREQAEQLQARLLDCRARWKAVAPSTTCQTCGQTLPAECVETAKNALRRQIESEGKRLEADRRGAIALAEVCEQHLGNPQEEADLAARRDELVRLIATIDASAGAATRAEELSKKEKSLAVELETIETRGVLLERWTRHVTERLESDVAGLFSCCRVRMFEAQVNGSIVECCEVEDLNGTPYNGALNHAARITIGMEIISVLGERLGYALPVWIDGAESIVNIPELPGRPVVALTVAAGEPLHVED